MVDDGADLARALDAFYLEHVMCADGLDGGVEDVPGGYVAWMSCGCGARAAHRMGAQPTPSNHST